MAKAATTAVSALSILGPRLIEVTNSRDFKYLISFLLNPPSGPIKIAHLSPTLDLNVFTASPTLFSSQNIKHLSFGQSFNIEVNLDNSSTGGT